MWALLEELLPGKATTNRGLAVGVKHDDSPAPSPAGPTHTHLQTHLLSVEDMLKHLKQNKLTEGKPLKPQPPRLATSDNVCLVGENSGRIKWIQPSGPRRTGEGTEDEEQGIIAAESTATGGAMVRITLLAAGFVIGPSGTSVREISKQTGADIKSWTEKPDHKSLSSRPTRSFVIEGKKRAVVLALDIVCDAVDRYKELCEGRYCGQFVARIQKVRGVEFSYQPPPRNIVPYAAALKGQHPRLSRAELPPAVMPAAQTNMHGINYSTGQHGSGVNSMSTQSNDSCSDLGRDERLQILADDKGQLHSKAQVMQTYLSAQDPNRASPLCRPPTSTLSTPAYDTHTSNYPNSPRNDSVTAAASKQYPTGSPPTVYTTPTPYQGGNILSQFRGVSPTALYSSTGKAGTTAAAAAAAAATSNPAQLVEVKRNVWLPLALVQQANGDPGLALHLAAQDRPPADLNDSTDSSPTAGKAWTPCTTPMPSLDDSSRQGMSQRENDSCSDSIRSGRVAVQDRNSTYAPWSYSSNQMDIGGAMSTGAAAPHRMQYDSSDMQSHFCSALSLKPDSATDCNNGPSKVDPVIEPPSLHTDSNQRMGGPYSFPQTTASKHASRYDFKSPTASLPVMAGAGGSNNAFVSPQCLMDNTGLFSYSVTTPEQTVHARPPAWFSTPETNPMQGWGAPPTHTPTTFTPTAHFPELNPSATMGQAYGWGGYSGMHDSPNGAGGYIGNPWQQAKAHLARSQYAASPEADTPYSTMAAGMGANTTQAGLAGTACLPWIQGSHPLLGKF
ncbi:hypothetical protein ABBQ32_013848 [Trebouxia sp. C0010 RCD-2024]